MLYELLAGSPLLPVSHTLWLIPGGGSGPRPPASPPLALCPTPPRTTNPHFSSFFIATEKLMVPVSGRIWHLIMGGRAIHTKTRDVDPMLVGCWPNWARIQPTPGGSLEFEGSRHCLIVSPSVGGGQRDTAFYKLNYLQGS